MTKQELDNLIIENINTNDAGLITGLVLQQVLLYLADYSGNKDELMELFLSKLEDDTAQGFIEFLKGISVKELAAFLEGIEVGPFSSGPLGSGAAIKMVNDISYAEVDHLLVRQRATFIELVIESLKHVGGQLTLSPARMKCNKVVDGGSYYKCYFDNDGGAISNEFVAGDQARCQVFTGSGTKFYWRLVTSVGEDWINLSKTDAVSGSSIPEAGDDIVQLGNRNDTTRQSAIILSTIGDDAPSWKQYSGINSFDLANKETTVFTRLGNRIQGKTVFTSGGTNLEDVLDGVGSDIQDAQATADSKSTTFLIQPTKYKLGDMWVLNADQTVNGIAYKQGDILTATQDSATFVQAHWVKRVRYAGQAEINEAIVKATYWAIKASSPVIYKDAINAATSGTHTPVIVSGELRSGTTTTQGGFITVTPNGGTEAGTATESPVTIAPANGDGKTSYTVKLYDTASKTTLLDTMTIPVVFKGASGVNAISAVLSNEADVLPASSEGVVSDYSGSGTEIRVFEGATELSYGTGNGQYQVSAVGSGITVGSASTSGNRRVYGVASNMTSDNATITFTITGKTASGTSFSLTKVQAFAKSKTGQKGDQGPQGIPGVPGADGVTYYTWIRYADTPTSGMSQYPTGKDYIGIAYNKTTPTESSNYSDYNWSLIKGEQGLPGQKGADGIQYYTWIKYADSPTSGMSDNPAGKAYIGIAVNKTTATESTNYADYTWQLTKGEKGDTGASAPLLYLSASAQVMKCNPDNTPQTGQTVSIEAKLQNVSGTATFVATPYNDAGTALTAITLGGSGNTRTLTNTQWLATYKRIEVVATLGSLNDKVTIYRVADGATGKGISGTEIKYQVGASGTTAPTGTWLTSVPTVPEGQFLWTRTVTSYTDSTSTTSYSVSKQGISGSDGKGISTTVITYQASSSGTVVPTGTWSGTIPSVSENQFLWTRTVITYTDSSTSTSYSVGKMGAKGDAGQNAIVGLLTNESVTLQANNAGVVSSFTPANGEFWVYNGTTRVTTGITFSKVSNTGCTATINSSGAYSVSAMTADNATAIFRAVYNGVTIEKTLSLSKSKAGADGVSITLVDVEFAKNTSPTTAPTTGWTTTAPTLTGTEQLWTRTKTTYSSGNPTYSTPANITPKKGDTGAVGQGVESVTEEYAISTSKTVQPTTGWSTTQPTWSSGMYIWSRVKVVYKNPASTVYTGYAVSSEWEAVNDLEIGGRNLFSLSRDGSWFKMWVNTPSSIANASDSAMFFIPITKGGKYTINGDLGDTTLCRTGYIKGDAGIPQTAYNVDRNTILPRTLEVDSDATYFIIQVSQLIADEFKKSLMFEKGNKATDWTPAPEDVQARIDAAKLTAEQAQLAADGYMRARYVRDWAGRNTANNYSLWYEIKVLNKAGVNIAQGKSVEGKRPAGSSPYSNITDGNTTTYGQPSDVVPEGETDWVKIDLGQIYYDIDYIQVWHYSSGGRTYYGTKTEISEDGVNWTTIFDSAIEGTYKETAEGKIHTQRYASVMNRLAETEAKTRFQTLIDGGLIYTALMKLFDTISGNETAFISGKQGAEKDLPAFGAGTGSDGSNEIGAYEAAAAVVNFMKKVANGQTPATNEYDKLAKIALMHNGAAKIGHFFIEALGRIFIADPSTGKERLVFLNQNIPTVAALESETQFGGSISVSPISVSPSYPNGGSSGMTVSQNGSKIVFNGATINITGTLSGTAGGFASAALILVRNGVNYMQYGSANIYLTGGETKSDSVVVPAITLTGLPSGSYAVKLALTYSGTFSSLSGSSSSSTLSWSFSKDVEWFQFGLNGMMAWYQNTHLYASDSEVSGKAPADKWDVPGVLLSATVNTGGGWGAIWGAKQSSTQPVNNSTGRYTVYHTVGHINYQVNAIPNTANRTCHIVSKAASNFVIEWRTVSSSPTLVNTGFDFQIIGNNYA